MIKYSMLIHELQLTKAIKDPKLTHKTTIPGDAAEHVLKQFGWNVLGTGYSGSVAEHPNKNYVLKLFRDDPLYELFLDIIRANQGNPHLPKISRDVKTVPGTDFRYVRMEKLSKVSPAQFGTTYLPEMGYFAVYASKLRARLEDDMENQIDLALSRALPEFDVLANVDINQMFEYVGSPDQSWISISNEIIEVSLHENTGLDVHDENFMARGNVLVFTDPF